MSDLWRRADHTAELREQAKVGSLWSVLQEGPRRQEATTQRTATSARFSSPGDVPSLPGSAIGICQGTSNEEDGPLRGLRAAVNHRPAREGFVYAGAVGVRCV